MTKPGWEVQDRTSMSFDGQCPWCGAEISGYNNLMSRGGGTIDAKCDCGASVSVHFDIERPRND